MGIRNFRNFGIIERLVSLGYLELIEDVTISVATTSVTFDNFTATKEDSLVLVADVNNTDASNSFLYLYANNNQTLTNYYTQTLQASGTGIAGERANIPRVINAYAGDKNLMVVDIKITNDGYFTAQSNSTSEYGTSSIQMFNDYVSSTFTITNLTQLDLVAQIASAIGIGSRFSLYRKVA